MFAVPLVAWVVLLELLRIIVAQCFFSSPIFLWFNVVQQYCLDLSVCLSALSVLSACLCVCVSVFRRSNQFQQPVAPPAFFTVFSYSP